MSRWAGRFASALLVILSLTGSARASPSRVVVVQSANESQIVNQATMRLRAELAASGFEVITLDRAPGESPREAVEDIGLHPIATLSIVSTEKGAAIDVWVADHLTGKTLVRRVDIDSQAAPSAPKVLAIRAVELLRASLLEAESAPPERPLPPIPADVAQWMKMPSAAPEPAPPVAPAPHPSPPPVNPSPRATPPHPQIASPTQRTRVWRPFSVELGAALIDHFDGASLSLGPQLRLAYRVAPRWALALDVIGPAFTRPERRSAGELALREELAMPEIVYAPGTLWSLSPQLALGIGAEHTHLSATAVTPYQANNTDVLSFVATVDDSVQIEIVPRVGLYIGGRALFIFPGTRYRIAGEAVSRIGPVSLAWTLGLVFKP